MSEIVRFFVEGVKRRWEDASPLLSKMIIYLITEKQSQHGKDKGKATSNKATKPR